MSNGRITRVLCTYMPALMLYTGERLMPTSRRELAEFDRTMETRACGVHFALVSAKIFSVLRPGKRTLGDSTFVWSRVGFAVETLDKIQ